MATKLAFSQTVIVIGDRNRFHLLLAVASAYGFYV